MKIVIISNGHGEDIIGMSLAKELAALGYTIQAIPIVGKGLAYEQAGFEVLGPRKETPSGGFVIGRPKALWEDFVSGLIPMSYQQYRAIYKASRDTTATLVVGDIYGILLGNFWGKRPLFQMQCLVSVRAWDFNIPNRKPYGVLERYMMRKAVRIYPREQEGADWLAANGVPNVEYLGNPMLDALSGTDLAISSPYLLLLPGSRTDAYQSLPLMMEAARLLRSVGLTPVVAWAGLPLERLEVSGWSRESTGKNEGLIERWMHPDGTEVYLTRGAFKAALMGAKLALSTSGTAAEQAAGFGIPVVGFPTDGPQYTPVFAENQKRLLREALFLSKAETEDVARVALEVWNSLDLQAKAQEAGKAAMGEPGAARRIALDIHARLAKV